MTKKKKYGVALADDHAILRKGLTYIVNALEDYEVVMEAADGAELIANIENSTEKPDICIMDIQMHGMNGYDATHHIRKRWPDISVLALSMHYNEFSIIRMLRGGAKGFLPKEAGPKDLEAAMNAILNGYVYYSDLVSEATVSKANNTSLAKKQDLNKNELLFLAYCCSDHSYKEIAEKMNISLRTVDWYRDKLSEKLNIKTRPGLVVFALQIGVEPMD